MQLRLQTCWCMACVVVAGMIAGARVVEMELKALLSTWQFSGCTASLCLHALPPGARCCPARLG